MTNANLKIVFSGSVGAGKSTVIQAISDIKVINTDEQATDEVKLLKDNTTVALDYGQMFLEGGIKVHLYGTPGQQRFDFMWEILAEGAIGVILLIDASSSQAIEELTLYLNAYKKHIEEKSIVVGVTHFDKMRNFSLKPYRAQLEKVDSSIPIISLDGRDETQIKTLIKVLLYRINPYLNIK